MVSGIESQVLAAVIPTELELNPFPGVVELVPVLLDIEKVEVVVVPSRVFTGVAKFIPRLLKLKHIKGSLTPLAARNR